MKEAYYFSHDANARSDPKILQMISVYGIEGYGMYWILIEMLREQDEHRLSMQGQYVWNAFALQLHCDSKKAHKFILDCIKEFNLFETNNNFFWSKSLLKRMKLKKEKSEKARQSANKRWNKKTTMRTHSERNANASKNDAIKESKYKGNKKKKNVCVLESTHTGFKKPELKEVIEYGRKINKSESEAKRFYNYYESKGWKVKDNDMVNWQASFNNWEHKGKEIINNFSGHDSNRAVVDIGRRLNELSFEKRQEELNRAVKLYPDESELTAVRLMWEQEDVLVNS